MERLIDTICKYIVLFSVVFFMGLCIHSSLQTGVKIDLPDWIVVLITLIVQYFFRKTLTVKRSEK